MFKGLGVRSLVKRIFLAIAAVVVFVMVFMFACRMAVQSMFSGIAQSRATGLSAVGWDMRSMWNGGPMLQKSSMDFDKSSAGFNGGWISRSAELNLRTANFDDAVAQLKRSVGSHHGVFEDLTTQSESRRGRALTAVISVPSVEFEGALADLRQLGRVEAVSEGGEDIAVKLGSAARRVELVNTNLSRLQKLQGGRKGELRDAVELEKEIAQARESLNEAERQNESLRSTAALARIRVFLAEDYRAPLEANLTAVFLEMRNSAIEGLGDIFSSVSLCLAVLFEYGLPLLFWMLLLFWPTRALWRRLRERAMVSAH